MPDLLAPGPSVTCLSCGLVEHSSSGSDPLGPLRSFLVRHGDCLTGLDLSTYRGVAAVLRA